MKGILPELTIIIIFNKNYYNNYINKTHITIALYYKTYYNNYINKTYITMTLVLTELTLL